MNDFGDKDLMEQIEDLLLSEALRDHSWERLINNLRESIDWLEEQWKKREASTSQALLSLQSSLRSIKVKNRINKQTDDEFDDIRILIAQAQKLVKTIKTSTWMEV